VSFTIEPIGYMRTCFPEKFGIPRQSLLASKAKGKLILEAPFNNTDYVEGLQNVSHLWISFIFHQHLDQKTKPKVRPPRLGGNQKLGVFATRSSFRPNNLGLSVCVLDRVEKKDQQLILHLSGVDILDGTPVVDIKPYVPYADMITTAKNKIAENSPAILPVKFSSEVDQALSENDIKNNLRELIVEVLQQDPRPAYKGERDQKRYKMSLQGCHIEWDLGEANDNVFIEVKKLSFSN
jgi:tRNA-Thr(GGU) m(6)t(6)A37 methyltransferase TsaA